MDPRLLIQLAVAIDLGSINRAAKRLNVTQPTLSRSIKIIEDRVGAPVLIRESHGVTATDVGERLAERGRAILAESDAADDALRRWREGIISELRLGVGPFLAATIIPGLVEKSLRGAWPYALLVFSASAAPLIRRLIDNRLDVVLAPSQLRLHEGSLTQKVIFPDRLVIVAGARSELARKGVAATKQRLERARWVIAGARAGIHGTESEIFRFLGIEPKKQNISITGDLMIPLHLLKTTDALVALPERLIGMLGDLCGAQIVQSDFPEIRRDIALWVRKQEQHRIEILHFSERLEEHLQSFKK